MNIGLFQEIDRKLEDFKEKILEYQSSHQEVKNDTKKLIEKLELFESDLKKFSFYLLTRKKNDENVITLATKVQRNFKDIKDSFIVTKIKYLLENNIDVVQDFDHLEDYCLQRSDRRENMKKESIKEMEDIIDEVFIDLRSFAKQALERILEIKKQEVLDTKAELLFSYDDIIFQLAEPMNDTLQEAIIDINSIKNEIIDTMEKVMININQGIKKKIKENKYDTKYDIHSIDFTFNFAKEREKVDLKFENIFARYVMGDALLNYKTWQTDLIRIQKKLMGTIEKAISEKHMKIKEEIIRKINHVDTILSNELHEEMFSYRDTIEIICNNLAHNRKIMKETEDFYLDIKSEFRQFEHAWFEMKKVNLKRK